jgi:predicted dehydrogenase
MRQPCGTNLAGKCEHLANGSKFAESLQDIRGPLRQDGAMNHTLKFLHLPVLCLALTGGDVVAAEPLRVGIIGLDTSHATDFTAIINTPRPAGEEYGCRVVAAYPQGSRDIASSVSKVPEYTERMKSMGVEIVASIEVLLTKVDAVLLETNDGRPHLEQLRPCLKAKKPVFVDKPIAGTLKDAVAIFEEAKAAGVPVFSSSALRFAKATREIRQGALGKVIGAETMSPAPTEPTHPDLFWYGIHGVESLVTLMGPGGEKVKRGATPEGKIEVTVTWKDGRTGIFREGQGYSAKVKGEKGEGEAGKFDGYEPLVKEIAAFFRTGKSPVAAEETLEIYAIMEAADESKRRGGAEVTLSEVIMKARAGIR